MSFLVDKGGLTTSDTLQLPSQLRNGEDALESRDKYEQAAHCAGYCHGTQTMDSNKIHHRLLTVRKATTATYA